MRRKRRRGHKSQCSIGMLFDRRPVTNQHRHNNQPQNQMEGESNKFVSRAAEERAHNTQQSAEREGLMWSTIILLCLLYA